MAENELYKPIMELNKKLGHNEDVEYSEELADAEDKEAVKRAEEADRRQEMES